MMLFDRCYIVLTLSLQCFFGFPTIAAISGGTFDTDMPALYSSRTAASVLVN